MVDIPATVEAETILERPYDASNPAEVNEARKKSGRKKRNRLDFVQNCMGTSEGREYFYDLMESCSIFDNPIREGDPHGTYYHLGRQSVGKQLLADAMQFPLLYMEMMSENK